MLYIIYQTDRPGGEDIRAATRDDHFAYLDAHEDILVLGGAMLAEDGKTRTGSVLIVNVPDRAARVMARVREMHGGQDYSADWGRRMRGSGTYARMIAQRFDLAAKRLGLDRAQPRLRCDLFKPPPKPGDQLSLF